MKGKFSKIVTKLLLLAMGIFLIVYPNPALESVVVILGVVLAVIGIVGIVHCLRSPNQGMLTKGVMYTSVALILLSIIPMFFPSLVTGIASFAIGFAIAAHSLSNAADAVTFRHESRTWVISLLLSIAGFIAGIVIAFYPGISGAIFVRIIGVALIYNAVVGLINTISYRPRVNSDGVVDITDYN